MKVLYGAQIYELQIFGGISLYFSKLMNKFHLNNDIEFEFPLVYSDNRYLKDLSFLRYLSFYDKNIPFKKTFSKYFLRLNQINTVRTIKKQEFDIFHPSYFDAYYLKYLKNKPFVLTIHDMTNEVLPEYFIFDKNAVNTVKTKEILIKKAARIIAISENTKNDILRFCDIDEDKIDVIYHGQPLELPDFIPEREGLPKKYILFVGQRAKYKNFINFLLSISEFLKEDKDLYLLTVGGPTLNKNEKEIMKNLNIESKVMYKPIENDLSLIQFYKNALCFVFPSLYEGFGFPVLEAFQCGCPLVCSNTSSFPEIASNAAVYFDPYDEISMKNNIKKVIYDENLRQDIINKGYTRAQDFDWNKTTEKTKKVYEKVLKNG